MYLLNYSDFYNFLYLIVISQVLLFRICKVHVYVATLHYFLLILLEL